MNKNIVTIDRIARIILGIILLAYALKIGMPETGWNFIGWLGIIPIATALFSFCPLYALIGVNTGAKKN
ncbi:MAG: DUF2892 domain-containing protein [Bacteroidota bacterium]